MNIEKLPLAERVRRCQSGATAYPEYIPSIIRRLGEMPVMEYMAGLDPEQQRRFSDLVSICHEDSAYQWAALRIAELRSPSAAAEAMRILAEPMIRYEDMFNENKLPPPARKPLPPHRPAPGEKLPLAERLRRAAGRVGEAPFLHIYRLYMDTYFYNLDILFGGSAYADTLEAVLSPYIQQYDEMPLLTRFVADSRKLPASDQTQVLYQVLIRPFAEIQKEKERMDRECLSLPF